MAVSIPCESKVLDSNFRIQLSSYYGSDFEEFPDVFVEDKNLYLEYGVALQSQTDESIKEIAKEILEERTVA